MHSGSRVWYIDPSGGEVQADAMTEIQRAHLPVNARD